jgi:hypothetical protein
MSKPNYSKLVALLIFVSGILFAFAGFAAPLSQAALDSEFTFTAVGDFGGTANTDGVLNGIANAGAAFHLALGDLSYGTYAPESAWCSYVQGKVGATFPFELVSGNHDMDASTQGHINNFAACLPDRIGNLTGTYGKEYYFDYQNLARVIFISPNLVLDGSTWSYNAGTAHYTWLSNAIDDARAKNIPWVIVGMHKNCITVGAKSCEIGTDVLNLLVAKNVDLILQGHDHNYQRSKQLALNANCGAIAAGMYNAACVSDDGADNAYVKGAGSVLNIVGTGGQSLYGSNPFDAEAGYFARFVMPGVDVARYGFLKVHVTATQLSAEFIGTSAGSAFSDAYTITQGAIPPTTTPLPTPNATTLIAKGAQWKYRDDGSNQGTAWRANDFDDSAWASGNAELGYGDGGEATIVGFGPDANNKYVTTYFRKMFHVVDRTKFIGLELNLLRDDGAVVYLNGVEVARSNMPSGAIAYNTYASVTVGGADESAYVKFNLDSSALQNGANVLAVEIHQVNATSSDISYDASLLALNAPTATPTATNAPTNTPLPTNTPTRTNTPTPIQTNTPSPTPTMVAFFTRKSTWRYLSNGSNPGTAWRALNFDDSKWQSGKGEFGYGDGDEMTVLSYGSNPNAKYITAYFRKTFKVTNPAAFTKLSIRLIRDDGAVVYLNGTQVARSNMPAGTIAYNTPASSNVTGAAESKLYNFNLNASLLRAGTNVLAVEVHQVSANSDDLSFDAALWAQ